MSIPWKQVWPDLPNNRFTVRTHQEKVFARYKDDEKALITKLFDSYLEKGYIRKLEEHEKLMPSTFPSFVSSRQTVRQPQFELFGTARPSSSTTEWRNLLTLKSS
jgi:hypothetical protein